MKRGIFLSVLLLSAPAWAASAPSTSSGEGWTSVEKTLGRPGVEQGEGFQVLFPRMDLNVVIEGFPLDSANVLVSRFTFKPGPEGSSKKDNVEGQVYLLDSEVPQAMAQAAKGGLEVTALYSPFLDESPCLKCLRLRGVGARSTLAWTAKMVLLATGTPMALPSKKEDPAVSPTALVTPSPDQNTWGDVRDLLGQGEEEGQTLFYKWGGKDREAFLSFQSHGKDSTALGELAVPEEESKALVEEFLQHHITVTALFTEDSEDTRRSFLDFWAVGEKKKLAEDLKEILGREEILSP